MASSLAAATALFSFLFISNFLVISSTDAVFPDRFAKAEAKIHSSKVTRLHFYFHDIVGGKHPTAVRIAGPKKAFGTTVMTDDPLTESPERGSKIVGRAQGLYAMASKESDGLLMAMNFVFLEGSYNGSALSILGRNHVSDAVREMPVVGGSGIFRVARGYALAKTVRYNPNNGDAVVEYNVLVIHG